MQALHTLDAFATWQGGLDYYFSTEDDASQWGEALVALQNLNILDAVEVFKEARDLFVGHASSLLEDDEMRYLSAMRILDGRWRESVPAVHRALSTWRAERGLEEFGAAGW